MEKVEKYAKFETRSDKPLTVTTPSGRRFDIYPITIQSVNFTYDDEGFETVSPDGESFSIVRFFPDETGVYSLSDGESFECADSGRHGCVGVSRKDPRYFAFSDGTPFVPIGMNLAFISPVGKSDGKEFGRSAEYRYLGIRQYERWFRRCAENGVNFARIWLGHDYFCPDTEEAGVFDPIKLAKIEALVALAGKYGIRLKLTLEQFRYFDYEKIADSDSYADDVFRKFNKRLYHNGKRCESAEEWLREDIWREKWLDKVRELARRFSGDPTVFGIELWNEMNCMPGADMLDWNRYMLPEVKKLFPDQLVMNSLGSYDGQWSRQHYKTFCWELSDVKQMHRYLDQGAEEICRSSPIELLRSGTSELSDRTKPFLVAETGAVNDHHSGPFRYYPADHNGVLFCDFVYTPLFCGAAGCGQIWHWDERYVEAKDLNRFFAPLNKLCKGILFDEEDFTPDVYEDNDVILLTLRGKTTSIGYLRNKRNSWMSLLRDLIPENVIEEKSIPTELHGMVETVKINNDDGVSICYSSGELHVRSLGFGALIKISE